MDDAELLARIQSLVDEEHRLEGEHVGDPPDERTRERLSELEVQLDQCWDLLRQRRAKREFGGDPDEAQPRPSSVVERYWQ